MCNLIDELNNQVENHAIPGNIVDVASPQ